MKIAPSYYFGSILFLAEALAEESIQKKEQAEKVNFSLRHNLKKKMNLAEIFSEARSGTIAHKKKRITAVTPFWLTFASFLSYQAPSRVLMFICLY